jgi:hypothetical protein
MGQRIRHKFDALVSTGTRNSPPGHTMSTTAKDPQHTGKPSSPVEAGDPDDLGQLIRTSAAFAGLFSTDIEQDERRSKAGW